MCPCNNRSLKHYITLLYIGGGGSYDSDLRVCVVAALFVAVFCRSYQSISVCLDVSLYLERRTWESVWTTGHACIVTDRRNITGALRLTPGVWATVQTHPHCDVLCCACLLFMLFLFYTRFRFIQFFKPTVQMLWCFFFFVVEVKITTHQICFFFFLYAMRLRL